MGLENNRMVDPVLTQIATGYTRPGNVGHLLFPRVGVAKEGGKIPTFGKEAFRPMNTKRAIRAESNRVLPDTKGEISFVLEEHDLSWPIDTRELAEDNFPLESRAVKSVLDTIHLDLEREHASLATTAANYPTGNKITLSGTAQFSDPASDPAGVVDDASEAIRSKIAMRPNTLVIPAAVLVHLRRHPQLKDFIGGNTSTKIVNLAVMREFFGIENIVLADAVTLGKTGNDFSDIWGKNMILAYVKQGLNNPYEQAFGYTLTKQGAWPQTDRHDINPGKTYGVRVTDFWDAILVQAEAGYLVSAAVA